MGSIKRFEAMVVGVLLAAAILAIGAFAYRYLADNARRQTEALLLRVATAQSEAIARWRSERAADMQVLAADYGLGAMMAEPVRDMEKLRSRMAAHFTTADYQAIALFDGNGRLALKLGPGGAPLPAAIAEDVRATQANGQPTFSDLHFDMNNGVADVDMDIIVPLTAEPKGAVTGIAVLIIDPASFLGPLMHHWPLLEPGMELVLAQRDGDQVAVVTAGKTPNHPDLIHRPLSDPDLPAAHAARGETGIVTGRDYRGIPVLAAAHPIPGSQWALIAKIEQAEVATELHRLGGTITAASLLAILAALALLQTWVRRAAAERSRRMERSFTLFGRCNEVLLHARDESAVWVLICDILKSSGGYRQAWVVLADGTVEPPAPLPSGISDLTARTTRKMETRQCLCDAASTCFHDFRHAGCLAVPLEVGGESIGTLVVHGPLHHISDLRERHMLQELASKLSWGLLTLRRRRERDDSAVRLAAVLDNTPIGVAMISRGRVIETANRAFGEVFGLSPGEMVGQSAEIFYGSHQVFEDFGRKAYPVIDEGKTFQDVVPMRRSDGTAIWVTMTGRAIDPDHRELGTVWAAEDVTARVEADRRLSEARVALQQKAADLARSNADLEQFAYVASHDLRQPLRQISSFVKLLERRLGDGLDQDCRDFITFACEGAERMDRLIVDLLDYSRIGRKGDPLAPVALDDALGEALANLGLAIGEAGATVSVQTSLPMVFGRHGELVRLFQNLVGNAIKYRHHDRPCRVAVTAAVAEGEVHVDVADNGIGIAPEHFERIFGIFQRLHAIGEYDGTGIGLAICRKIMDHHGGRIEVSSTPGEGSTFRVTLPLLASSEEGGTPPVAAFIALTCSAAAGNSLQSQQTLEGSSE